MLLLTVAVRRSPSPLPLCELVIDALPVPPMPPLPEAADEAMFSPELAPPPPAPMPPFEEMVLSASGWLVLSVPVRRSASWSLNCMRPDLAATSRAVSTGRGLTAALGFSVGLVGCLTGAAFCGGVGSFFSAGLGCSATGAISPGSWISCTYCEPSKAPPPLTGPSKSIHGTMIARIRTGRPTASTVRRKRRSASSLSFQLSQWMPWSEAGALMARHSVRSGD